MLENKGYYVYLVNQFMQIGQDILVQIIVYSAFIREVLYKNENRIIATVMPAHFYRIQEIFNEVSNTNRKIVIMGKTLTKDS